MRTMYVPGIIGINYNMNKLTVDISLFFLLSLFLDLSFIIQII